MAATNKTFTPKTLVKEHPEVGSEGYLANLRSQKRGPRYFKRGRKVIYREGDVLDWLFANPVLTIDQND